MKKMIIVILAISLTSASFISCADNHAAETTGVTPAKTGTKAPAKTDDAAIGSIETLDYTLKLHRAFEYKPKGSALMANWAPKKGYKFIYLDVSLRNKRTTTLDGGFVFIALRVTDKQGIEYKRPATALAGYLTDHPDAEDENEYDEMWSTFQPNESHRALIYAVEVPENINDFELSLPTDHKRKEWNKLQFSL